MPSLKYNNPATGEWEKIRVGGGSGASTADKVTVTDETAELFGLGEGATVDGVLQEVPRMISDADKVGDIKTTIRTDLGDAWLLANGSTAKVAEYPDLAKFFSTSLERNIWNSNQLSNFTCIKCITYANGYWVIGGYYKSSSTYYARIAYSDSLTGSWITKDLWSSSYDVNEVTCITYANGHFVVGGKYCNVGTYGGYIAYTTDPTGTWTTKQLWSSTVYHGAAINCLTYADGYWVAGGIHHNGTSCIAKIAYTTDPTGTWESKSVWSYANTPDDISPENYYNLINCVSYADGLWIVGGMYTTSKTSEVAYPNGQSGYITTNYSYARLAYSSTPTGSWATKDLWNYTGTSNTYNTINCITYADGLWAVGGCYYNGTGKARLAYTADISGEWTLKDMWSGGVTGTFIDSIKYADGYWAVGGAYPDAEITVSRARLAYTRDISGEWKTVDMWNSANSASYVCVVHDIVYENEFWVAAGIYNYASSTVNGQLDILDASIFNLPRVTTDNAYCYIKAKGD